HKLCTPPFPPSLSALFLNSRAPHPYLTTVPTRRSSDLPDSQGCSTPSAARAQCRQQQLREVLSHLGGRERAAAVVPGAEVADRTDRKSTRLNSSHVSNSDAVFCLRKNSMKEC